MKVQTVTISFFHFKGLQKWWALRQMKLAPIKFDKIENLIFYKMMGSGGGNGFSILPDLSVYIILCVWDSFESAKYGLKNEAVLQAMQTRTSHHLHLYMKTIRSKGSWEGINPFEQMTAYKESSPIAILTRATIAPSKLFSFWKNVPKVSSKIHKNAGLIFSKGIGELPLIQQATFSLWQSRQKMIDYAYRGEKHLDMIRKTKELQWYREEMFTEFTILNIDHQWPGLVFDFDSTDFIEE